MDGPCQIHGHPDKPANHTNISCWVFKQAGKLNAEHKGRRPPGDSDDEETHQPNTGGQKQFPPKVKTVNMVYVTHNSTGEQEKHSLRTGIILRRPQPKYKAVLLNCIPCCPLSQWSPFNRIDQFRSWTSSLASAVRLIYL